MTVRASSDHFFSRLARRLQERPTLLSSELEEPIFMSSKCGQVFLSSLSFSLLADRTSRPHLPLSAQVASTRPERSRQHAPVPTVLFSSRLGDDSIDALGDRSSWRETGKAYPFLPVVESYVVFSSLTSCDPFDLSYSYSSPLLRPTYRFCYPKLPALGDALSF